ncbi:Ger(x)C family spore germination protein [Bacillaceae bacterium Marseille-Q3522]|nr:Ger(x)C family spore germination protein [Bacillaceae bacterium Marseille-Q3522]
MKKYILLLLPIFLLTGCWSKKELNELAIATALGIDKTEDGYLVSVQIVNPNELVGLSKSGRAEAIRYMGKGKSIFEAYRSLSKDIPRKIYLSHLRQIVFGEELAQEGIGKTLDFISRDHEMRTDFFIAIARGGTAHELLKIQTTLEKVPTSKLFEALENSELVWAQTKTVKLDELINSIVIKGKEPVITGIKVYGDPESGNDFSNVQKITPETGFIIDNIAVLKKDKLIGWLNDNESKAFNFITNNVKDTIVNEACGDGKVAMELIQSKTSVKGEVKKGKPKIDIHVISEGNIGEVQCKIDLSDPKNIIELQKKFDQKIKDNIENTIKSVQDQYQSDIFGFGEVLHRSDPKAWKQLKQNWDQEFANLEVAVHVKTRIRRLGSIMESFQKEVGKE